MKENFTNRYVPFFPKPVTILATKLNLAGNTTKLIMWQQLMQPPHIQNMFRKILKINLHTNLRKQFCFIYWRITVRCRINQIPLVRYIMTYTMSRTRANNFWETKMTFKKYKLVDNGNIVQLGFHFTPTLMLVAKMRKNG